MPRIKIIPEPKNYPYKCALTGRSSSGDGPFIDTSVDIPNYGRLYLQVKYLIPTLQNDLGFLTGEKAEELKDQNRDLKSQVAELSEKAEDFDGLLATILNHIEVPVEERVVTKVQVRQPTDEEIAEWIESNGASHPIVQGAKAPQKGSTEEWNRLYGDIISAQKSKAQGVVAVEKPKVVPAEPGDGEGLTKDADETRWVELHSQEVDLDEVLAMNVKDVLAYAEGQPLEFIEALVTREMQGANRKGIIEELTEDEDE